MIHKTLLTILSIFLISHSPILAQGDDPCSATALSLATSCNTQSFSNTGATTSSVANPTCPGFAGGDVWFSFTMPTNGFHVVLELSNSAMTSLGMAVYQGSTCGSLTEVSCDLASGANGLPRLKVDDGCHFSNAGETFYVRIWEEGNDEVGTFDLCAYAEEADGPIGVTSCESNPVGGNTCCDAILLSDILEGYCGNTGSYDAQPSNISAFCAIIENNSWIAFEAAESTVSMQLTSSNCMFNSGLQIAILSTTDCVNFNVVSNCYSSNVEGSETLTATNLTPGEVYYLMVDGFAGDACEFRVDQIQGVLETTISASDTSVCAGGTSQLSVNATGTPPFTYNWDPIASLNDPTIQNPIATPSSTTTYTVTVTDGIGLEQIETISINVQAASPSNVAITGTMTFCGNSGAETYVASANDAETFTWSVSGNASINGASDQNQVDVSFTPGTSQVCIIVSNACGTAPQLCETIEVNEPPQVTAQTPPAACSSTGFDLDQVIVNDAANTGGVRSYYQNASDATAGTNMLTDPLVYTGGVYWIRVATGPNCFDLTPVNIDIDEVDITVNQPAPACAPASQDLNLVQVIESNNQVGNRTYFPDSLDAVNAINALSSTVVSSSGTYWVRYELPSGCFDVAAILVNIQAAPDIADFSAGTCAGGQLDLSTLTYIDGSNTTIVQTLFYDNLGFANLGIPTLAMSSTLVGPGTYYMRTETSAGCFEVTEITVTMGSPIEGEITGGGMICEGSQAEITFSISGNGPFEVVYSDGSTSYTLTGISDGHTETVTINNTVTFSLISIIGMGSCNGNVIGSNQLFTVQARPEGSLGSGSSICEGDSLDLIFNLTGTAPFDVIYSDGSNQVPLIGIPDGHIERLPITSDVTFNIIQITDATGCTGTITGMGADYVLLPSPTITVTGGGPLCEGEDAQLTFNLAGNGPFDVQLEDASGVTYPFLGINDGQEVTQPITSTTTFVAVTVTDANGCQSSAAISNEFIVYPPLTISDIQADCSNIGLSTYTVSFEINGGWPATYIVSGSGSLSGNVFTSDPIVNGIPFSFMVNDNSGCDPVPVSGTRNCDCLTDAGAMDDQTLFACQDDSIDAIHDGNETLDAGDMLQYVLHDQAGNALGNVYAISDTPEFFFQFGMTYAETYYISPIAGPDDGNGNVDQSATCFAVGPGTPVIWYPQPVVLFYGPSSICAGDTAALNLNVDAGVLPFDVVISDGIETQSIVIDQVSMQLNVSPATSTIYKIISIADRTPVTCGGKSIGIIDLTVFDRPVISDTSFVCNDTNTAFEVVFSVTGGDPSTYQFSGMPGTYDPVSQQFTSVPIPNGAPFNFGVEDANGCPPFQISGVYECPCTSYAGSMQSDTLRLCGTASAPAIHNSDQFFDADDVIGYVLHDVPGDTLGNVMLSGANPFFAYDNSMNYGQLYYISAVVGDDDGSGFPILNYSQNRCLAVSPGQPVAFYPEATVSVTGDQAICRGDSVVWTITVGGADSVDITYLQNGETEMLLNVYDGYPFVLYPDTTTTIEIISVNGADAGACPGLVEPDDHTVTVTVTDRPVVSDLEFLCNDLGTFYTVQFSVMGGDSSTLAIDGNPGALLGGIFVSEPIASGDPYFFEVSDAGACPPIVLSGTEYCRCTPDIQPVISQIAAPECAGEATGALMVRPQNGEPPFNFAWSNGETGDSLAHLASGWYYVTMVDGNLCPSVDSFFIDEPAPLAAEVLTESVSCYGEDDGFLEIYDITGGEEPYQYFFDTFPMVSTNTFSRLQAGLYHIGVVDRKGCLWQTDVEVKTPEDLRVDLGDDQVIRLGDTVNLVPDINRNFDTIMWYTTMDTTCADCDMLSLRPQEETVVQVVVEDNNGCQAKDQVRIYIDRVLPIYIPNIFTPDGDGINDRFTVYADDGVEQINSLQIFSRWGEKIFENTNFQPGDEALGWDGLMKNGEIMSGVYVYAIEVLFVDGTTEVIHGDLTLLR